MTVAELIKALSELPPDLPVQVFNGYDADLEDADEVIVRSAGWERPGQQCAVIQ